MSADHSIKSSDFELVFPQPEEPLLEGPGDPVPWAVHMEQIATQTNRYLENYGHEPPPPPPEKPFKL